MTMNKRLLFLAIAVAVFVIAYLVGAASELTYDTATKLKDEFSEMVKMINAIDIFLHNFRIAILMFVPALGILVGVTAAFSTGMMFNALVQTTPELTNISPLALLATPFGVMEICSYGIAMSRSAILTNSIIRIFKNPIARNQRLIVSLLTTFLIEFVIVATILFASAFIEFYMIEAFNGQD